MDARSNNQHAAKADLYLCLAQAFMPPMTSEHAAAMATDLAADLRDIDQEVGYGLCAQIDAFVRDMHAVGGQEALLVLYSQLFLAPPRKVHLNVATYLDGAFNGGTVHELEECYLACGLARSESFPDLADHITVQLEFIAHLFGNRSAMAPGRFIAQYPERWIHPLLGDTERVQAELGLAANPYRHLLTMLACAIEHDTELPDGALTPNERRQRALAMERHKRAEREISAQELKEIRAKLAAHGLSTEHLDLEAGSDNDPWQGWQAMTPPSPRKA